MSAVTIPDLGSMRHPSVRVIDYGAVRVRNVPAPTWDGSDEEGFTDDVQLVMTDASMRFDAHIHAWGGLGSGSTAKVGASHLTIPEAGFDSYPLKSRHTAGDKGFDAGQPISWNFGSTPLSGKQVFRESSM